jgi:hypothetical protein
VVHPQLQALALHQAQAGAIDGVDISASPPGAARARPRFAASPVRIAMWSGPRNISTAMMRAWENRDDCAVSDEPLYAHYLQVTQLDHPARDEVIAAGDTDLQRVVARCAARCPAAAGLVPEAHEPPPAARHGPGLGARPDNVFLIRDPALVVASYVKSRASVVPTDIGLLQQAELFDAVAQRLGRAPPVIDAERFLQDPRRQLRGLCQRLGIAFSPRAC